MRLVFAFVSFFAFVVSSAGSGTGSSVFSVAGSCTYSGNVFFVGNILLLKLLTTFSLII